MEWPCMKWWLTLLCTTIMVHVCVSKGCLEEEKTALLDFKQFLRFNNLSDERLMAWVHDSNSDCCGWERVTCDSSSGQVIHLSLDKLLPHYCWDDCVGLNLSMFLPFKGLRTLNLSCNWYEGRFRVSVEGDRAMSALKTLETLDLSWNHLNRSIMKSFIALPSLRSLILAGIYIDDGPFPLQDLSGLRNLEILDLSQNHIHAPFPIQELSNLRNLELLDLSQNNFSSPSTSTVVASTFSNSNPLSSMKKLRTLNLANNIFDKEIFKSLAALPALRNLLMSYNMMAGDLDENDLAYLKHLEVLILRGCSLRGMLPIQGLCEMKNLQELDLSQNSFGGTLHPCLGNLTSLRAFDLSSNVLSGTIPSSSIAGLDSLEYLSFSNNSFEGIFSFSSLANHSKLKVLSLGIFSSKFQVETEYPPWTPSFQLEVLLMPNCLVNLPTRTIPTFLAYQHSLKYINLSYNNMAGMFPNWLLVNNPKLVVVLLNDNSFTGSFQLPANTSNHMDQLRRLNISNNKVQGQLPKNIGSFFPNLEYLDVSSNMFDGEIPTSIGDMSRLMKLHMDNNHFSGEIPKLILTGCTSLDFLKLSNNNLVGPIFPGPLNLTSITTLLFDNNHFNGTLQLQEGLIGMDTLLTLDISGNELSGTLPSWIGNLTVSFLRAARNNFVGAIPEELCNIDTLGFLDLSHNGFSGTLPSCVANMEIIHLQGNSLTGTIPEAFFMDGDLMTVDLRNNKLSGNIPKNATRNLEVLLLSGNQLQGEIPSQLCLNTDLRFLDLSRNNFVGSIPTCFNNMSFGNGVVYQGPYGGEILDIRNDLPSITYQYPHFDISYFDEVSSEGVYDSPVQEQVQFRTKSLTLSYQGNILNYMSGLDLSCNQLTGEIPYSIGDLLDLHALNLSHNHLNGSIPESFHKLEAIESIDLSNNNLWGEIPLQLQELNYLVIFNVSYNNLSGSVPSKGQFGTFDESNYRGNPYLSWNNSNRGNPTLPTPPNSSNDKDNNESMVDFSAFVGSFFASYVTVLLSLVAILWINHPWRRAWFYFINICLYKCFPRFLKYAF